MAFRRTNLKELTNIRFFYSLQKKEKRKIRLLGDLDKVGLRVQLLQFFNKTALN